MVVLSNLAWPEDPFATGQVWRKKSSLLAAMATHAHVGSDVPASYSMVFLRLPTARRQPAVVTQQDLRFGFKTIVKTKADPKTAIRGALDLDLLHAARHAHSLAGHGLRDQLERLDAGTPTQRGVSALRGLLKEAPKRRGVQPRVCDTSAAGANLSSISRKHRLTGWHGGKCIAEDVDDEVSAAHFERCGALSLQEALVVALACASRAQYLQWSEPFSLGELLDQNVWDCFQTIDFSVVPWGHALGDLPPDGSICGAVKSEGHL